MKKAAKIVLSIAVIVFALLSASYAAVTFKTTGKMNKNVYIANIDVTGSTKQKVCALLTKLLEEKQSTLVVLKTEGYETTVRLKGTVENTNMISQINRAYEHGRKKSFVNNLSYWFSIRKETVNLSLEIKYNELQIDSILESVKNDFINGNKSAIIKRINNSNSNQSDLTIDIEATKQNIKKYLCNETNKKEIEIVLTGS
ncbi:MAG: hypothetical protein K0R15_1995 [Clostridiales bacterium]|jgi:hypothetical protein|nr:hypothetical protein [Clostridiales bacterium]